MKPPQVRLLPWKRAEGRRQMAADEWLLETAASGQPGLRFYGWPEATVSLGYFQSAAECQAYPGLGGLPLVRRASGGATLVHDREVTYALALPAPARPPGQEPWPRLMHSLIGKALHTFGVKTHLCARENKKGRILCFLHHTPGDLVIDQHKIAGSAQRKLRGAVMQHGSILLAQSPATPELPGIREITGVTVTAEQLIEVLQEEITRALGWKLTPQEWTEVEETRIGELRECRYGADSWNRKR